MEFGKFWKPNKVQAKTFKNEKPSKTEPGVMSTEKTVKRFIAAGQRLQNYRKEDYYDFPDGNDNGESIPYGRSKAPDLAELTLAQRNVQASLENQAQAKKKADKLNTKQELSVNKEDSQKEE